MHKLTMNYNDNGDYGVIGNQSSVVIQTQHDLDDLSNRTICDKSSNYVYPAASSTLEPSVVRIDRNDLVFRVGTSKKSRANDSDGGIPVTSFLNGYCISKGKAKKKITDEKDESQLLQALSESIHVIGQAMKGTVPNPHNEEDKQTQLTTRVQGTGTIVNTGEANLVPGDTLIFDLFTSEEVRSDAFKKRLNRYGFGASKVPLKTIPMSAAHVNFTQGITAKLATPDKSSTSAVGHFADNVFNVMLFSFWLGHQPTDTNGTLIPFEDYKKDAAALKHVANEIKSMMANGKVDPVNDMVEAFMYFQQDIKRREIGKVLSYASPGKSFDVLFGAN